MNELADMIVDKLLTTYIREQATWYTTSTMDEIYDKFQPKKKRRTKKQMTEADLLGELAKLMTQLDYHCIIHTKNGNQIKCKREQGQKILDAWAPEK